MTTETLLQELDGLTYDGRMRRMAELGRAAGGDAEVAAVLADLAGRGTYERVLALQSCYGSRDGAHALRSLSDASRSVCGLAVVLIPLICTDEQVQAALEGASSTQRVALLRRLKKRGRLAPVDAYLKAAAAAGETSAAPLMAYGSGEAADDPAAGGAATDWARLARHHPERTSEALRRRAEAVAAPDRRLLWQANAAMPFLADAAPDAAVELARALLRHAPPAQVELQRLARRRPAEVARLLLEAGDRATVSLDREAHRLDTDLLLALLDRAPNTLAQTTVWFERLSPEARREVYAVAADGWMTPSGALPHQFVALLPRELREAEGRRHLALPALATRPAQRLPYASFLPWEEARAVLEPSIRDPDPDLRVCAIAALVYAARYHRDRLGELLGFVRARKNEQDPVRCAMLTGLADLPPGAWQEEHLEDLGGILREALNAADLSYGTASAAERLVLALLPFHPAWAAGWLATLVQERGQISFHDLGDRLSDEDVRRIAPHLMPVLRSWERREREYHLLAAATSLGRRLKEWDELADVLERLVRGASQQYTSLQALVLLKEHRPERARRLIPVLLERDPSWATQAPVYLHLHLRRQDLLTPFLGRKAYRGRFSTGKNRFLLPVQDGFHRWTPGQQATFAETLEEAAGDTIRDTPAVLATIRQLRGLAYIPPARLLRLAEDSRQAVQEAALRALGTLDGGEGVPALLSALDDDRARIAIYALRGALLEMPPARALTLLRGVPTARVTVAKEVVRLLGDLKEEGAYRELLRLNGEDLHRDVRVALLRALWEHLEREETWPVLEEAARSADSAVATMVARTQNERLSPEAQARLASLLAGLMEHPEPTVRKHVLDRCVHLPVADREQALLQPLLRALNSGLPDECAAAARAVFITYTERQAVLVGQAVSETIPNRRALAITVDALQAALAWSRTNLQPTVRAVANALSSDPLTVSLRLGLVTAGLPWEEVAGALREAAASGELHPDALSAIMTALGKAATRSDAGALAELEASLAASEDERLRRLALAALTAGAAPPRGWDAKRRGRLERYRNDASPLVAGAAQFTFPPPEPEPSSEQPVTDG